MKILFYIAAGGRALPMPNLGIAVVATPLLNYCSVKLLDRSNDLVSLDGYDASFLSMSYISNEITTILDGDYDFVAFQVHSGNLLYSALIIEQLYYKKIKAKIIIGGPSSNVVYNAFNARKMGDYFFFGDSADTLFDFLVRGNLHPSNMLSPGFQGAVSPYLKPSDVWKYPEINQLYPHNQFQMMPFLFSSGCIFDCSFCTSRRSLLGFNVIQNPEQEFTQFLEKFVPKLIRFNDSTFNGHRRTFLTALHVLSKAKPTVNWGAYINISALQESDVEKMQESNCSYVYIGLESAVSSIRLEQEKRFTNDKVTQLTSMLKSAGINILTSIIIGLPGETLETIRQTEDYILQIQPTAVNVFCYEDRPDLSSLCDEKSFWRLLIGRSINKRFAPQSYIQGLSWNQIVDEAERMKLEFIKAGILYGESSLASKIIQTVDNRIDN